ncbi:MAG: discoidin domain-containing protein [Eubacteriales bacterium]|nr:discoidin domain-containing protein [Eubacteriales bacterium]
MKKKLSLILAIVLMISLFGIIGSLAAIKTVYTNIAVGATYEASEPYTLRTYPNDYQLIDGKELTDGVKATTAYGTEWHAFCDNTGDKSPYYIIVDLAEKKNDIKKLSIQFQDNTGAGIVKPVSVVYSISDNGTDFTELGTATESGSGAYLNYDLICSTPASGRYFKAVITKGGFFTFASEFEICTGEEVEVSDVSEESDVSGEPPVYDDPDETILAVDKNSQCYISGDYLCGVPMNTDYKSFLALLNSTVGIKVLDKNRAVKTSGAIISGDSVVKTVNDEEVDTKIIMIDGDVNGDGEIKANDYLLIKRAYLGTYTLTGVNFRAACITNGTSIVAQDYLKIKREFLGTYSIHTKYENPITEYDMTFTAVSASMYRMNCTYENKPFSLTFDKKTWGTWNIGTWTYDGKALAGGGTDWEYVFRSSPTSSGGTAFTGGNHENERLVEIKFYDGSTNKELNLSVGKSESIKNLKIVEKTQILFDKTTTPFCDVVRTYRVAGNNITLDVEYSYIKDVYFELSYTCMFPIAKTYGLYIQFNNLDGTKKNVETLKVGASDYSGPQHSSPALDCTMWGYLNDSYKFDVKVYTLGDSCDFFKNDKKTFYWDMNTTHNKLYYSKYNMGSKTLVKAGTTQYTRSSWTFYIDESVG